MMISYTRSLNPSSIKYEVPSDSDKVNAIQETVQSSHTGGSCNGELGAQRDAKPASWM